MPLPRLLSSAVIALESEDMSTTSPATLAQSQPDGLDWERMPNPAASSRAPYKRRTVAIGTPFLPEPVRALDVNFYERLALTGGSTCKSSQCFFTRHQQFDARKR